MGACGKAKSGALALGRFAFHTTPSAGSSPAPITAPVLVLVLIGGGRSTIKNKIDDSPEKKSKSLVGNFLRAYGYKLSK
jgi:hypothetical protein